MGMWVDKKRYEKSGKIRLAYREGAKSKPKRLPVSQTPHFDSIDDAENYCRRFNEEQDAKIIKIRKDLDYAKSFHDFDEYLMIYENDRKEKAPNSWQNNVSYLKGYVFPFFLGLKREGNLAFWEEYFEDFRDWLKTCEPQKKKVGQSSLSISSMNHCFKSLNTFLETIRRKRRVKIPHIKCPLYPRRMLKLKGHESVLSDEDFEKVFLASLEIDMLVAEGFRVTRFAGLRENEMFGLSLADVFQGMPTDELIKKKCDLYGLKPFGYIVIDSQPTNSHKVRSENGRVPRKPLKHKKAISPENSKIIPITDKETFNILVRRWKEQRDLHKVRKNGEDKKDYLLFDELNKNRFYNKLKKAYEKAQVKYHSPHDMRHTFCTGMARTASGDIFFSGLILGHSDHKTTERYWHISEAIHRNLKIDTQIQEDLEFVE